MVYSLTYDTAFYNSISTTGISSAGTSSAVWPMWANITSASDNVVIWQNWRVFSPTATNFTTYTDNTTLTTYVWQDWNREFSPSQIIVPPRVDTRQHETMRLIQERKDKEAAEAASRAEVLLRDHLTAEQLAVLIKSNYFDMVTDSGKRYRVTRGRAGNVYLVEKNKLTRKYCIHPDEYIPDADTMLAQKLLLESDEALFLRLANESLVG